LIDHTAVKTVIIVLAAVFFVFTLYFFRDPHRNSPIDDNAVLSPADGTVVLIKDVDEDEFLKKPAIQVSIFMSPLNVHVNRFPVSGTVGFFRYIAGEYIVAMEEKSSERNERTHIGIDNGRFKIMMKQIAGFIARRIVCDLRVGDRAVAGERFGMIKFGSRVDVIMPREVKIKVALDQRVTAGETILAVME
jgi:phosphatidylserine decarboxylase